MIKFSRTNDNATIPSYHTKAAVGFDFAASEDTFIPAWTTVMVPLGLKCEFSNDLELQIRGRSSNAKRNIIIPHGVGTVDPDYRGELSVPLFNASNHPLFISTGERIAQGVLSPIARQDIQEVDASELSTTSRGEGGFGSTGTH